MKTLTANELALYLGQEVERTAPHNRKRFIERMDLPALNWFVSNSELKNIKPILRPLSDITEEELVDLFLLDNKRYDSKNQIHDVRVKKVEHNKFWYTAPVSVYDSDGKHFMSGTISLRNFTPEQFEFMLSKGFDLFNWIEQGTALDKTTLK